MVRVLRVTVVVLFFLLLCLSPAIAQSGALTVEIQWPNYGETVYGGPTSLLYKIPIKGVITSSAFNLQDIDVQLELFNDGVSLGTLLHRGQPDGSFSFEVTVNPHASTEQFTIGFTDCGLLCHSEGEMALQPGHLLARVTALAPDGSSAADERPFIVDVAATATVPVEIVLAGEGQQPVSGVNVSAATWLYMWRSRFGAAQSDESGLAEVRVEALGQSPTRYEFRVEPTIVNGVLYRGQEPVTVQLPKGASDMPAIQLAVRAYRGHIDGKLAVEGDGSDHLIHAISLPDGSCTVMEAADDGVFQFDNLPVDQYLLAASLSAAQATSSLVGADWRYVDLTQNLTETVRLSYAEPLLRAEGYVQSEDGAPLPFAVISNGDNSAGVLPNSGQFFLRATSDDDRTFTASAPGFYSTVVVAETQDEHKEHTITLKSRPGTQALGWGSGKIVAPAENVQEMDGRVITLHRGYLWGEGEGATPYTISLPEGRIEIHSARFALRYFAGEHAWLYVFEGEARVVEALTGHEIVVESGQMLNLLNPEGLTPVSYDPFVISALDLDVLPSLAPAWEPSAGARARNAVARLGIGTAQLITFVTYLFVTLTLVSLPIVLLLRFRRS